MDKARVICRLAEGKVIVQVITEGDGEPDVDGPWSWDLDDLKTRLYVEELEKCQG